MALTDNLLAFYKLNDLTDSSGNGNTLTNNGDVTFSSGKIGNAAVFDGTNWLSSSENTAFGTSNLSVSMWVNASNLDNSQKMAYVGGSGGFVFSLLEGTVHLAKAGVADLYDFSSASVTNNSWFHVVMKREETTFTCYINGTSVGTYDSGSVIDFTGTDRFFGAYIDGLEGYSIAGQIDAVGIWDRALSEAEVTSLYNSGTGLELEGAAPSSSSMVKLVDGVKLFGKTKFVS